MTVNQSPDPLTLDPSPERPPPNIAMWGAPGSGKTTLLAALNIALLRKKGEWSVVGANRVSTDFLTSKTTELSRDRTFPQATKALENRNWYLIRQRKGRRRWWAPWRKPKGETVRIGLNLVDPPGGFYGNRHGGTTHALQELLLENLAQSRGILFLFDPIRENLKGDAFEYLYGALAQLAEQVLGAPDATDGKLPHYLAVCITKFDDYKVLETARRMNLITVDPDDAYGFPRVEDDDARELFHELCTVSATGNADMVISALERFFHEDRVRYFVTSSIGFYVDPKKNVFDWNDYQNLIPAAPSSSGTANAADGDWRIRGRVHPINVMEPVIWLGQRIAAG